MTRSASFAALAAALALAGCGSLYTHHSSGAYRSNAGFTRDNPPPVGPSTTGISPTGASTTGPAVSGPSATGPGVGAGHPTDIGSNSSQGAPVGGP